MDPAVVTVALRLWSSDGALLDRGFIGSLCDGLHFTPGANGFDIQQMRLYTPLEDRIKGKTLPPRKRPETS